MRYSLPNDPQPTLAAVDRLCRHYDHLKALMQEYTLMRQEHTYARMADPNFTTEPSALARLDDPGWLRTSLIIDLATPATQPLLDAATSAYREFGQLIHRYAPACQVDIYVQSAHITVKTLVGDVKQGAEELQAYLPHIQPIIYHWLALMGDATELYAVGLFSSLSRASGLALGLRLLPSLPLLQLIRGAVGVALYEQTPPLLLRPEDAFHTMLTHSTGLRARLTDFPLNSAFINDFRLLLEQYDRRLFGIITHLEPTNFVIRHGHSNQLVPLAEVNCMAANCMEY